MLPQTMFPVVRNPECPCPPRIVSYVGGAEDDGDILIYDATTDTWEVGAPNPGDITAVNTTLPLTGGGGSGAITLDINTFTGDAGAGGLEGTVPAPAAGDAAANKFLKASGSWTAIADADLPVTLAGHTLTRPLTYNVAEFHQTLTDQATITWDMDAGGSAQVTLTASRIFGAPTNLRQGATYMLQIIQGGAGSFTITAWNGVFKWPGGVPPVLSTAVGAKDLIALYCPDGTNLWGVVNNAFA